MLYDAAQDVSNFDTVFTTEAPMDSVVEGSQLSQTVQAQFAGALMKRLCCWCTMLIKRVHTGFSYDGTHMPISPS